jgi:hypothetical protein
MKPLLQSRFVHHGRTGDESRRERERPAPRRIYPCRKIRVFGINCPFTGRKPHKPMSSTIPSQQEITFGDEFAKDPDFYFATQLISRMQRELHQQRRHLLMVASRWLIAYEYLKQLEERILLQESPLEKEKRFFEGTVTVMAGLGRLLIARLEDTESVKLEALGITHADLVACVAELADIDRAAHRETTEVMRALIESEVFGAGQ